jgi:hypothetical protein
MVTPLRERLTAPQRIQGFGLNLEVSVLTLLFLISVGFISCGLWLQLQNITKELSDLQSGKVQAETRAAQYQKELEDIRRTEMIVFLTLDGVEDVTKLKYTALTCTYDASSGDNQKAEIALAPSANAIKVTLKNLKPDTFIKKLIVEDGDSTRKWSSKREAAVQNLAGGFQPLQPVYDLREVK